MLLRDRREDGQDFVHDEVRHPVARGPSLAGNHIKSRDLIDLDNPGNTRTGTGQVHRKSSHSVRISDSGDGAYQGHATPVKVRGEMIST